MKEFDENKLVMVPLYKVSEGLTLPSKVCNTPNLDLKPLPTHLKYAFLGIGNSCPVIVKANLSDIQLEKLLSVLTKHKKAIGWTINNLVSIPPSFCTHRINLEDGKRPFRDAQRRLNPNMKEVVYKEIVK